MGLPGLLRQGRMPARRQPERNGERACSLVDMHVCFMYVFPFAADAYLPVFCSPLGVAGTRGLLTLPAVRCRLQVRTGPLSVTTVLSAVVVFDPILSASDLRFAC